MSEPIVSVRDLCVYFEVSGDGWFGARKVLRAVDGVSFDLDRSETLGIVGESGCGKSTLARAVLGLVRVTSGEVRFEGQDLARLDHERLREQRQHLQIIFQDPLSSLDPRMNVGQIIAEPLRSFFPRMTQLERRTKVVDMMRRVGLLPEHINRYPHEFSGGQAQRIGIARALITQPEVVVCDEPVSALDVSIKAQIVNLLADLQAELGLSLLFIAHDLASVRHVSHRVMVLYLGKVMELAPWDEIYRAPRHPYTQALIQAIPPADPQRARAHPAKPLGGELPSPIAPPSGCVFRTRCPYAVELCAQKQPVLRRMGNSLVACHLAEEIPKPA
ncbi:MAG TPA: dipeptide ABC transporter ATP-binding protein [Candidatus Acidoferrales bacterium]|jgi:oligopeptide transport system ATP-binding protein|nr:dipeptide ABC transporter ATP-binding protein [Candidatus Acidoferrales bacterium]